MKKSKRLKEYDAEFNRMKPIIMERARGMCEAPKFTFHFARKERGLLWNACDGSKPHPAVHVHHRKYRSRGGTNAESNLIALCNDAHSWTHAHGGFGQPANLLGLALSAGESEDLK